MDLEAHQPLESVTSKLKQGSDVHKRGENGTAVLLFLKFVTH